MRFMDHLWMENLLILCPCNSMNCMQLEGKERAMCLGKYRKITSSFLLLFTSMLSTYFVVYKQDMKVSVFLFTICPVNKMSRYQGSLCTVQK